MAQNKQMASPVDIKKDLYTSLLACVIIIIRY